MNGEALPAGRKTNTAKATAETRTLLFMNFIKMSWLTYFSASISFLNANQ